MSIAMSKILLLLTVLLLLLNTSSSTPEEQFGGVEKCFKDGSTVTYYKCRIQAVEGILQWNGVGFDCPSKNTATNNVLAIHVTHSVCSQGPIVRQGMCGAYSANLTCAEDDDHIISVLRFEASYGMNGGNITCLFRGGAIETFTIRVGVTPNPPSNVRVNTTQQDISCNFHWSSPINESIGGIAGYEIHYGENCVNCTPQAGFLNQTEELTAGCRECFGENTANNMCYFEVSTVSKDCLFSSLPVEATSNSPINTPMDIAVAITCSLRPNPPIYVEWIYTFSGESRSEFLGFLVTISDQFGHIVEDILSDSKVRLHYVNSTVLRETDGFVGDIWNITLEAVFGEDRNKFAFDSIQFSVEDTIMLDTNSAVTPSQCIDVSINDHCDERSDTFQAQIQFIEGSCESDSELTNSTSNYTLNEDYKICVPVVANTICYSAVIFHTELELGSTKRQKLVLLSCKLETSNSTRVNINSTIGEIPRGIEIVLHNTILYLSCDFNCTLDQNQTRCANGTFQPSISPILQDGCRCSDDSKLIIGSTSAVVLLLLVVVVIVLGVCLCCRKRKNSAGEDLLQSVESDHDDRDRGASNASYVNIELTQQNVSIK